MDGTNIAGGLSLGGTTSVHIFSNRRADDSQQLDDPYNAAAKGASPIINVLGAQLVGYMTSAMNVADYKLSTIVLPILAEAVDVALRRNGPTSEDEGSE